MHADRSPIVELRGISKRFPGVQALADVSLAVYAGEMHAVIGENGAGKSTLMNILAGELQPDAGDIVFMGQERHIANPYVSQQMGISVVYQELALCPNLSVAENVSLSTASASLALSFVKRRQFVRVAAEVLARLGLAEIDLNQPAGRLNVAQQQLIEIAKAISGQVRLLILDEPNSALSQEETEHLFQVLRQLRDDGVAIIYVSHRLEEVLDLCDRITILRDGKLIETVDVADATIERLISRMVGRVIDDLYQRQTELGGSEEIVFAVDDLRSGDALKGVSLVLRAGEILGIAGLPGCGKDELVECCFGLRPYTGEIAVKGEPARLRSPSDAIRRGLGFIPADRRGAGALLVMNVQDNIVAASLPGVSRLGLLRRGAMRTISQKYVKELDIRIASLAQQMATLSGGNQQKVILARCLVTQPSVLILHEPTRGIDVGAKAEIYRILQELAAVGVGVLIVSSELPELIGQCDRILALHAGAVTGHFQRHEASEERILACAMGQAVHLPAGRQTGAAV
jgi:ABC-type sugar transport system ATPase subunit